MKKLGKTPTRRDPGPPSLADIPFRKLVQLDEELRAFPMQRYAGEHQPEASRANISPGDTLPGHSKAASAAEVTATEPAPADPRICSGFEHTERKAKVSMRWVASLLGGVLLIGSAAWSRAGEWIDVGDDASLRQALSAAGPGTRIRIAPGEYRPGIHVRGLQGTPEEPIVIEGADPHDPPRFHGGSTGWQLSDCAHVTLRHLAVSGQSQNGINIDDGGTYDTPSRHLRLEHLHVSRVGPRGNRDGIKLSGVVDFVICECTIEGWGGQAIDMVGCHRGLIERCRFVGRDGFSQGAGPQAKGGSSEIVIRQCLFLDAGQRAINIGGSTGLAYFRPQGAPYEARDITVEGCQFVGSTAPLAFVGVDGATVRYNTIYRPERWVLRILQETTEPGFVACRHGVFERNLIVYRRDQISTVVNIGPHTAAETFRFADNFWFCEDRPAASRPEWPAAESGGVYGIDPQLEAPAQHRLRPRNPQAAGYGAHAWPDS